MKKFPVISYGLDGKESHRWDESWDISDTFLFCPNCGKRGTVWISEGTDYYVGHSFICDSCGATFYSQGISEIDITGSIITFDGVDVQRLLNLRME